MASLEPSAGMLLYTLANTAWLFYADSFSVAILFNIARLLDILLDKSHFSPLFCSYH